MRPLPVDDLPRHSEWAAYLLDPAGEPPGDPEAYAGTETYEAQRAKLLEAYREISGDPAAFERRIRTRSGAAPDAISVRGDCYLAAPAELAARERETVREALEPVVRDLAASDSARGDGPTVFDLGCGRGRAARTAVDAFPEVSVHGGEYGATSVELARELTADLDRVTVDRFDFTAEPAAEARGWPLFEGVDDGAVVFTRGAITTLDDAEPTVERLASLATAGPVAAGVHLEQVDVHPDTTLGLLRRRYSRLRGYGDGLLDALEAHDDVAVTDVAYDVVGANPLHPHTRIRWAPA
jgi:SAM-dependent methyltransferase